MESADSEDATSIWTARVVRHVNNAAHLFSRRRPTVTSSGPKRQALATLHRRSESRDPESFPDDVYNCFVIGVARSPVIMLDEQADGVIPATASGSGRAYGGARISSLNALLCDALSRRVSASITSSAPNGCCCFLSLRMKYSTRRTYAPSTRTVRRYHRFPFTSSSATRSSTTLSIGHASSFRRRNVGPFSHRSRSQSARVASSAGYPRNSPNATRYDRSARRVQRGGALRTAYMPAGPI
ncbi:hypothetical protein EVAR_91256_1 [Eumeta japonica]|uniref:Uncharacterized protein n=1 Tax=Eumeta variegata TaxID=151549 RepID=A0A4C2A003_EUMVA|nr:hypothetical protein EVAR_91256_1 [Eumeta japonica]